MRVYLDAIRSSKCENEPLSHEIATDSDNNYNHADWFNDKTNDKTDDKTMSDAKTTIWQDEINQDITRQNMCQTSRTQLIRD